MRMIVDYNGNRYESASNNDVTVEETTNSIYEEINTFSKLKIELKDGGFIIFGESALKLCAISIIE